MLMKDVVCNICSKNASDASERGTYLTRVNPPGELPAVWVCAQSCVGVIGSPTNAIIEAIEGKEEL